MSDIQGVQDIYTDPQIHSLVPEVDVEREDEGGAGAGLAIDGGAGNLGHAGIVACLSTLLYSPQIYYLGLPPFFLSTVEVAAVKDKLARENDHSVGYGHGHVQTLSQPQPVPELSALHEDAGYDASRRAVSLDLSDVQESAQENGDTSVSNGGGGGGLSLSSADSGTLGRTYSGPVSPRRAASLSDLSARTVGASLLQCSHAELWQHGEMHCCFGLHYCWPWWQRYRSRHGHDIGGKYDDPLVMPHPLWHPPVDEQASDPLAGVEPSDWSTTAARFHLALAVAIVRRIRQQQRQLQRHPQQQQQQRYTDGEGGNGRGTTTTTSAESAEEAAWIESMASFAAAEGCASDDGQCDELRQADAAGAISAEQAQLWQDFASDWLYALRNWGTRAWAVPPLSRETDGYSGSDRDGDGDRAVGDDERGLLLHRAECLWKSSGQTSSRDGVRPSLKMIVRAVDVIEGRGSACGTTSSPLTSPVTGTQRAREVEGGGGRETSTGAGAVDQKAARGSPTGAAVRPRPRLNVETLGSYGLALE